MDLRAVVLYHIVIYPRLCAAQTRLYIIKRINGVLSCDIPQYSQHLRLITSRDIGNRRQHAEWQGARRNSKQAFSSASRTEIYPLGRRVSLTAKNLSRKRIPFVVDSSNFLVEKDIVIDCSGRRLA